MKEKVKLNQTINEFINNDNKKNEIIIGIEIFRFSKYFHEKIYFLDNSVLIDEETGEEKISNNLRELSDENTKLFIQYEDEIEKEYKFEKYFIANKIGKYKIRLILKTILQIVVLCFIIVKK